MNHLLQDATADPFITSHIGEVAAQEMQVRSSAQYKWRQLTPQSDSLMKTPDAFHVRISSDVGDTFGQTVG